MADAAITGGAVVDLPGPGAAVVDEFFQAVHGHLGVDQQGQRLHGGARNRHKVGERGVGQAAVERGVDDHDAGVGQHQGVAIGRGLHHLLRPHRAACAGFVVHQHRLTQHALQLVAQEPRVLIQWPTSWKTDHDAYGLAGEDLR